MQIISEYPLKKDDEEISLALGFFDGIHKAHKKIIMKSINSRYKSAVMTFDNHPFSLIESKTAPKALISDKERNEILEKMGLDKLYIMPFNKEMMNMSAESFIKDVVLKLNVREISIGFNYTFGYKGMGNAALLKKFGDEYNFTVNEFKAITEGNIVISSTLIRNLILNGNVYEAKKFLGRRYSLRGSVINGRRVGRQIGIPTANISPDKKVIIPKSGVYITKTSVDNKYYYGITNVGNNPTFKNLPTTVETNLFDFDCDIYDKEIKIEFEKFIRGEVKFSSVEALKSEIESNIGFAKEYINKNRF